MERAVFYAIIVGGVYSLCVLVILNNVPIAAFSGALVGFLALLRGISVWA